MWSSRLIFLLLLFLGAFCPRIVLAVFLVDPLLEGPKGEISNDDVQFNKLAINLIEGVGYRVTPDRPLTSIRAPGFPFVLAGLYAFTGFAPLAAYVFFAVLGAIACLLTYLLAQEVLTENGARLAGVFAALYFPHIYMATQFISENVFIPCLTLALWLIVRYLTSTSQSEKETAEANASSVWLLAAAGLLLGYATLTRPGTLLLLPLLLGVLVWSDYRAGRFRALPLLLFTSLFLGVIVPWTIRNHQVHGKWVLIATNGGTTFRGGNNDRVLTETKHLGYWIPSPDLPERDKIVAARNEAERDAIEWQLGKDWVRDNLTSMPLLTLYKCARLWWLPDYGLWPRWLRVGTYAPFFLMILAFALRCSWRGEYWTQSWQVLHASTLAVIATAVIFCGEPRYRDSNLPVLMIYAVAGILPSWRRENTKRT